MSTARSEVPATTPVPTRLLSTVDAFVAELGGRRGAAGAGSDLERDLGLGSLERIELLTRIERDFGVTLPDAAVREARTPEALVQAVLRALASGDTGFEFRAAAESPVAAGGAAVVPSSVSTLVELARFRAEHDGDRVQMSLLADDLTPTPITY
ncbi:MAG: acyl carrier protein, partial [Thermoanaerobaculia bacterium]|nr:acyl carrier protein [Thermoanaerobaculia bacterium]